MNRFNYLLLLMIGVFSIVSCEKNISQADPDFQSMIQPVPVSAKFINDSLFIWGGSLVKSPYDENYHLFYSHWPRSLKMGAWVTHSEIAHAVADSPFGPFVFHDVALPEGGTNFGMALSPIILPFMFLMESTTYIIWELPATLKTVSIGITGTNNELGWLLQMILLAHGNGRTNRSLIFLRIQRVTMPLWFPISSVIQTPDGKYLMIYKAVAKKGKAPRYAPCCAFDSHF